MTPNQQKNVVTWIEALLSGRYRQGFGFLYNENSGGPCYCVNGVLAETAGFPRVDDMYYFGSYGDTPTERTNECLLPAKWFEEFTGLPVPQERFASMNDCEATFVQIATYLVSFLPDGSEKARLAQMAQQRLRHESGLADLDRHIHEEAEGDAV